MLLLKTVFFLCTAGTTSGYVTSNSYYPEEDICVCPCLPSTLNFSSEAATTVKEAQQKAAEIERELTLDKSSTSASTRTKTSQPDTRVSAKSIGAVGVVFIVIVFGTIVVLDISSARQHEQRNSRRRSSKRRKKDAPSVAPAININVEHYSMADLLLYSVSKSALHFPGPLNRSLGGGPLRSSFPGLPFSTPVGVAPVSPRPSSGQDLVDCLGQGDNNPFGAFRDNLGVRALQLPYRRTSEV
ncbi:unnamed protein product [Lymnaea stagnalis]|uniref:Transmembrane protein n=1 Tax=Lymnaea stagnalis TaxID=6523 RepID=A0AAV2H0K8_LYMST